MSAEENKALVRQFIELINAHKEVIVPDQFFGRDYESHNEELPLGLAGV